MRPHVILLAAVLLAGCGRRELPPADEGAAQCNQLLKATFIVSGDTWLAAESLGTNQYRLVQFRHPEVHTQRQPVTETQRLNGVEDTVTLSITCDQIRWWDHRWSEWQEGTGGGLMKNVVLSLSGGLGANYVVQLTKKHGEWSVSSLGAGNAIRHDPRLVRQLAKQAGL